MRSRFSPLALGALALATSTVSCKGNGAAPQAVDASPPEPPPSAAPSATAPPEPTATPAAGPFEGSIRMRITLPPQQPVEASFQVKGDKLRLDMPEKDGHTSHAIVNLTTRNLVVFSEPDKTSTTSTIPPNGSPPTIKKSGAHEQVQRRDCDDWDVTESTGSHEALCISPGIPFVDLGALAPTLGLPSFGTWMSALPDGKGFPLRIVIADTSGAIVVRAQAIGFEAHPVADAQFTVPPGYHAKH